ncbi:MAG: fibronectin type III domain-containing protein [Nitrospirae bacterium]|nr:fibronectin type III domain-containing protein [Nitrospirota bacterium]
MTIRTPLFFLFIVGVVLNPVAVLAVPQYLTDFDTRYGTSGTRLNACNLCHPNFPSSTTPHNNYANDFQSHSHSFSAIETLDSDGDGWTNKSEIDARFFPGNASDEPAANVTVVTLSSNPTSGTNAPGLTVVYTLQVSNTGQAADVFDLTLNGNLWSTILSVSNVSLAASANTNLTVTVTVLSNAQDGASDTVVVTARSRGNNTIWTSATLTTRARRLGSGDSWGKRNSSTSRGKVLLFDAASSTVFFYDGTNVAQVQQKDAVNSPGNIDNVVFTLGSGSSPGQVVGAWRRGTDDGWVWVNDGSQPKKVTSTTLRFGLTTFNPEGVAIADGCVLMILQQSSGNTTLVKDVFQVNPADGVATNVASGINVTTGPTIATAGAGRVRTSNCKAAFFFDDGANPTKLVFYNGTTTSVIDSGVFADQPSLSQGRIVYVKTVSGISQVFLYDSTTASPAPVQLTTDTAGQNSSPQTDGRHVSWLHTDGTTRNIILNGGVLLTSDPSTRPGPPGQQEPAVQLQRGQLVWLDAAGALRYYDGSDISVVDIAPATSVNTPWLADGDIAYLTDIGPFVFTGVPPSDGVQPSPPIRVTATPGDGRVTVAWDQILGAASYNLYYAEQSGVTKDNYSTLTGGATIANATSPFTLTGLSNNKHYSLIVTAVEGSVEGPGSPEVPTIPGIWTSTSSPSNYSFFAVAADPTNSSLVAYAAGKENINWWK